LWDRKHRASGYLLNAAHRAEAGSAFPGGKPIMVDRMETMNTVNTTNGDSVQGPPTQEVDKNSPLTTTLENANSATSPEPRRERRTSSAVTFVESEGRNGMMMKERKPVTILNALLLTITQIWKIITLQCPSGTLKGMLLACTATFLNQATGSTGMLVYGQKLLSTVGVVDISKQDLMAIGISGGKLAGIIIGLTLVDRINRRTLLGYGAILMAIGEFFICLGSAEMSGTITLIGLVTFVFFDYASWGPSGWILNTELTQAGRDNTCGEIEGSNQEDDDFYATSNNENLSVEASQAMAVAIQFATGSLVTATMVSVKAAGPWYMTFYVAASLTSALYALFLIPELRGLSIEEIAPAIREGGPLERWWKRTFPKKN